MTAQVAHVLNEEMAAKMGRSPGAGLQLIDTPPGFDEAIHEYLERLGRRRDFLILVERQECVAMLGEAGFRVQGSSLGSVTEQSVGNSDLLAAVVTKASAASFREVLEMSPKKVAVIGCDCVVDEEPLLAELDRLVVSQH